MKVLILGIGAIYILAACDSEKKSTDPTPPPPVKPAAAPHSNPLKAPIDRTRNVLDEVKKRNAGEQP